MSTSSGVQPDGWKAPRGYANAVVVAGAARLCFFAGQIAWDAEQRLIGRGDFVAQFRRALANVVEVGRAAGGAPESVVRLTIYVTDKRLYQERLKEVGAAYREVLGRHYPAMALVQVADLLEDGALVEIEIGRAHV